MSSSPSPAEVLEALLDEVRIRASSDEVPLASLEPLVQETQSYLASERALADVRREPYWPKWETPWWRVVLLFELGCVERVPGRLLEVLLESIHRQYLSHFPLVEEELPAGKGAEHILCHCALGTIGQALAQWGVALDREFPWFRPWIAKYQLPDGGWNCDEQVYSRSEPHSSFLSTVCMAEFALCMSGDTELECADRAADYLERRRLFRSLSRGMDPANEDWLTPAIPRYYEYDVLRGLRFLSHWAERRSRPLHWEAIRESVEQLATWVRSPSSPLRPWVKSEPSLLLDGAGAFSIQGASTPFPLLEAVTEPRVAAALLRREWSATAERLTRVEILA